MIIMRLIIVLISLSICTAEIPIIMHTWAFPAAQKVWSIMKEQQISAIDAVVIGCSTCEELQCDHTVGYGGSPDENGESTLDAMIFDGTSMDMGAVANMRRIKNAIGVARHVLENTEHSMLAGYLATQFARNFNFPETNLATNYSMDVYNKWKDSNCQPNFWKNVEPDPQNNCGPYRALFSNGIEEKYNTFSSTNHDTIGMIAIDSDGNVVAGTSTNGANHKIPGRVGDSPIPGAGGYADSKVGAAVATGDGDVMMRFLPSFLAVEELRRGSTPKKAAQVAIERIVEKYPKFFGAVLVTTNKGEFAAACNGMEKFPFYVASKELGGAVLQTIECD